MSDLWEPRKRTRRVLLAAEALALVIVAVPAFAAAGPKMGAWAALPLVLLLAATAARRFSMKATAALAVCAGLVQLIEPETWAVIGNVLYAPICYHFGASRERRWRRFGFWAAVAATVLAPALVGPRLWPNGTADGVTAFIFREGFLLVGTACVALGGWAIGFMRWQHRTGVEAQVDAQIAAAERGRLEDRAAQAREREHIATEMHDVVAHSWAVVAAQADGARYALKTSPEQAEQALELIAETARSAIGDLRRILAQLRYEQPEEGVVGPEQQAVMLDRLRASGLDLHFTEYGVRPTNPLLTVTAYRVLSEALTNALKHGDASKPVEARLDWSNGVTIDVANTIGSWPSALGTRHGLIGMRERVEVAGGHLDCGPRGDRWLLHAVIPEGHE